MYTGTLIEELIATVERAEKRARGVKAAAELENWYPVTHSGLGTVEQNLLGVR